jgi:hypothetical protein
VKNNIDFYQHYANADQHPKFKMLRATYGWEGEGRFWALNNRIAQADDCCLDVTRKYNCASIAVDLNMTIDEFNEFINFLISDDCQLIKKCEDGRLTTDIIQENYQKVTGNRAAARERSQRRWEKSRHSSGEKEDSSGEKVCKVKESKVNNNNIPDSPESGLLDVPEFYTTKRGRKLEGKRLETFNNFWDAFNFKNGKAEAADAWLNIPQLTDKLVDVIINAAKLEAQKRPDIISKGNTPKWAQGWLTGKRWEDEGYQEPIKPKITMFKVNDDE